MKKTLIRVSVLISLVLAGAASIQGCSSSSGGSSASSTSNFFPVIKP